MAGKKVERNISNRRQLFDLLRNQMQTTFSDLKEKQRLSYESSLIKSYLFEVNRPEANENSLNSVEWLERYIPPK